MIKGIAHIGIAEAPAPAIPKALKKAGIGLDETDLIEITEAFAAMPLVATKILFGGDAEKWKRLQDKTNINRVPSPLEILWAQVEPHPYDQDI